MKTVQSIMAEMRDRFKSINLDTPELDARLLVQGLINISYEDLLLNPSRLISDSENKRLIEAMQRRIQREPVSRILGMRSFWNSEFKVSRETLDPRADSETLVEAVLKSVPKDSSLTILDLGTGTGCLLLSLLQELPQARGVGIDISADAIQTAEQNAKELELSGRASFTVADWTEMALTSRFDVVISNPPYIAEAEISRLEPEVRQYDPHRALAGGIDGLDCYRSISKLLAKWLTPQGKVFLEIGYNQAKSVKDILAGYGFCVLQTVPDLAGHDRCIVANMDLVVSVKE